MPFPSEIKSDVLVASARHCSVCRRYKGVKVEVHHIKQESEGGPNTFKNAICLCFDCHCDAGHYNPKHPRGTKFSQKELKKARDEWYEFVKNNQIETPLEEDKLLCQYYICKNYSDINKIVNHDLSCFPFADVYLCETEIFNTFRLISSYHKDDYRWASQGGNSFNSIDDYIKLHPDAKIVDKSDTDYPYYETFRIPSRQELIDKCVNKDGLVRYLLEADAPIEDIAYAVNYLDACAGTDDYIVYEQYNYRELWCVFLTLKNINNAPLILESLNCRNIQNKNISYNPMLSNVIGDENLDLSKAPIQPNLTVVIPIALILPPFKHVKTSIFSTWSLDGPAEIFTEISHCEIDDSMKEASHEIGSRIMPVSVNYDLKGNKQTQKFHALNLSSIYIIDQGWAAGSCPHLFYIDKQIRYSGELLSKCQNEMGFDSFIIPGNVFKIIIAEIEDETTFIKLIKLNGKPIHDNIILRKGQFLELDVEPGMNIDISGYYIPDRIVHEGPSDAYLRNNLISNYMDEYQYNIGK